MDCANYRNGIVNAFDVIVVGQGLAGLATAMDAAARGLRVGTFEAEFFGGLVANRVVLDFFPAAEGMTGMDYAAQLAAANAQAGVVGHQKAVTAIRSDPTGFLVECEGGDHYQSRAVVMASGARLKKLSVPGEQELEGRGVSHCADCDGPLFHGQTVVVAGGGDSAFQSAVILARDCKDVWVVFDKAEATAHPDLQAAVRSAGNVHTLASSTVTEIVGTDVVTAVKVTGPDGARTIAAEGIFVYVGLEPNTALVPLDAVRNADGFLATDATLETTAPGLWAVGQVRSQFPGLLVDALQDARQVAEVLAKRLQ
jgi:thioredoxin reductase (NADPH)